MEALPRVLTARRFNEFSQKAVSSQVRGICMETDLWKFSPITSLSGLPTVILALSNTLSPHLELG